MKNLYLHFYRDTRLKNKNALGAIDSTSQLLLHLIAVKKIDNKPMTVTEAMSLSEVGGPSTIHRKLDQLKDANLIETVFIGSNRRRKYLIPSKESNMYFDKLSEVMIKTVDSFRKT